MKEKSADIGSVTVETVIGIGCSVLVSISKSL